MGRRKLIRTSDHVYHVTSRSNNKEWWYLQNKEVWKICKEQLAEAQTRFSIEIHNFVLMTNHYHLMIRTPDSNLDKVMAFMNKKICTRINMSAGRINRVFGGPYRWNLISERRYYFNAYKYLYLNPVEAKLCQRAESYPYSTLRAELGLMKVPFKIKNYMTSVDLEWINQRFTSASTERIRRGFRKAEFKPVHDLKSLRHTSLELM